MPAIRHQLAGLVRAAVRARHLALAKNQFLELLAAVLAYIFIYRHIHSFSYP